MNYNYPQSQYQQYTGYGGYKPTPQYSQWPQTAPLPQVRPVSSIDEVRACPIDFDGSVFYFADVANKRPDHQRGDSAFEGRGCNNYPLYS